MPRSSEDTAALNVTAAIAPVSEYGMSRHRRLLLQRLFPNPPARLPTRRRQTGRRRFSENHQSPARPASKFCRSAQAYRSTVQTVVRHIDRLVTRVRNAARAMLIAHAMARDVREENAHMSNHSKMRGAFKARRRVVRRVAAKHVLKRAPPEPPAAHLYFQRMAP